MPKNPLTQRRDVRQPDERLAAARTAALEASQAARRAQEFSQLMQRSGEHIDELVQSLLEITAHAKLVALNAAIEAARAGEHGMGFAVLADEMRRLAERSDEASRTMARQMHESSHWSDEAHRLGEEVEKALERIAALGSAE
jgi:methyl-accepting chemotaxis protein